MFAAAAFALGCLFTLGISLWGTRVMCPWCNRRHPKRDPRMTTIEYMKFHCDGWKAIRKQQEAQDAKKRKTDR